ncbi:hypothetical protein HY484_00635 [Candidatus Woesearchaeota archaeon]|nr:hypothetical protein [Candidatus Woesearchaeota archaeon]
MLELLLIAGLSIVLLSNYGSCCTDMSYSEQDRTLRELQNNVVELITLKNKALADQRDFLLNSSVPIVHARVNTLAEIVQNTMALAFIQSLVDAMSIEANLWWGAQEKQQQIDDNNRRIQKLPSLSYEQLEEAKRKGINII